MKKKPFILLELLIAFALVSSSILPFIRYPYEQMKKEIDLLFEMEIAHQAEEILGEIQAEIYQNKVPLEVLFNSDSKATYGDEKPLHIHIADMKRKYRIQTYIFSKKQKKGPDGTEWALATIKLVISSKKKEKKPFRTEAKMVIEKVGISEKA